MPSNFNLSSQLFSEAFWRGVFVASDAYKPIKTESAKTSLELEFLRSQAEYDKGSISASSTWGLFLLCRNFKVRRIIEVGAFIGRSTISMRVAFVVFAANVIASAHGAPRWESIASNEQGYYHIDTASITRDGDRRSFNSLLDYRRPQTSASGKSYQSVETQLQVNCRMKMARIVHMTYYSGPMLKGNVVERQGMLQDWVEVDASSPVHRLVRYAC